MAKSEYRSAVRSRKRIHMALADLLQEKPLDKITVTDVVRRAGINRGTFYAHFSDIPDVIHHASEELFSHLRQTAFEAPVKPEEIPHVLLQSLQKILESEFDFCQTVMTSGAAQVMIEQMTQLCLDYLLGHEEKFGFGSSQHYALAIRFCAGGMANLYHDWFCGRIPLTLEQLTQQMEQLLNRTIASAKEAAATAGERQ